MRAAFRHVPSCDFLGGPGHVRISCDDPEREERVKARALTDEEARAIGCPSLTWPDEPAPAERTYTARKPGPAVTARVTRAWERIEHRLAAHAAGTLRDLGPGAEPERLAAWEAGAERMPDDLYASSCATTAATRGSRCRTGTDC
ncbi:hypothetical protein ACIBP6_02055 [Nonomuraea terrae]|uniref:hypothetical protein n=1 Tax=Nonomuraea terrae TaxID=2530383 RepID=UPI0037945B06